MSRPAKKRSYEESVVLATPTVGNETAVVVASKTTTATVGSGTPLAPFVLEQQIESLKVELEHERSMRELDNKRSQHSMERLEKKLEFAVQEEKETQRSFDEYRKQSERMTSQLREAKNKAMEQLRNCEIQLLEVKQAGGSEDDDDEDDYCPGGQRGAILGAARGGASSSNSPGFWKEKCRQLEQKVGQQEVREQDLHGQLQILRSELEARKAVPKSPHPHGPSSPPRSPVEEAPPAVLKELNRVRIVLAETERRERQLIREVEGMKRRINSLIQEREEGRLAVDRLPIVREQLHQVQGEYEALKAQHKAWSEFGQALDGIVVGASHSAGADLSKSKPRRGPPELSTIQRFLEDAKTRAADAEKQKANLQEQNKQIKSNLIPLETKIQELSNTEQEVQREKREVERKLSAAQRQVSHLETQQGIYLREIENLQTLVKTFDDLPLASSKLSSSSSSGPEGAKKTMELSLATAREELKLVKGEKDRLSKEVEDSQTELERVKDKFGKLRDALHAERAKAEEAVQRANDAEALAGKGSFNPETTRVLHLEQTPLMESLKEEIKVLQRQLVEAGKNKSSVSAQHDPAKLNKRLKENFKEQIALFREGVYLMTGYKIDMLPTTDRPTFRVRSMFAEQEDDHLMLKWPKENTDGDSGGVSSLDILNTDLAKTLTTTQSYQYMTKFHSLPAFMASVQLHFFEKQTMMM